MFTTAWRLALAVGLGSFCLVSSAWAGDADSGDPQPVIEELEGDAANQAVIEEPLGHAKKALQRAREAGATGDVRVAPLLTRLAMEWATTARDVLRAAGAEAQAMAAAKKAAEVRTKVDRARALLAETQARRGKARAELERLKRESGRQGRDVDATATAKGAAKAATPAARAPNPPPKPEGDAKP